MSVGKLPAAERETSHACGGPPFKDHIRLAIVADFIEEQWPSMDLVSEMLTYYIDQSYGDKISVSRLCPVMQPRFTRIPLCGESRLAINADRFVNRFHDYPRWLRRRTKDFEVFHIVDHSYAHLVHELPAKRTVVTCHDLDAFRCLLQPDRDRRPAWFRAMARRNLRGLLKAARVLCVSATVRSELLSHGLLPPERLAVISNGVHPSYSPNPNLVDDETAQALLAAACRRGPLLLNVGIPIPRKRLDVLLRVFAVVRQEFPEACLVRVGGPFSNSQSRLVKQLELEESIVVLPFIQRNVLAAVYRRADLLLHTSEAEGFGLPLVEAMACGCPVVASDLPVLREVGGQAVTFCPTAEVPGWSDTVIRLLYERQADPTAWNVRRREALARAALFSWVETARKVACVYHNIVDSRKG